MGHDEFLARIVLSPTVSRGRGSGWRTVCEFEGMPANDGAPVFGFELTLIDRERLEPGDEAVCRLRLWAADFLPGPLLPGTRPTIYAGRQVGTGVVIEDAE